MKLKQAIIFISLSFLIPLGNAHSQGSGDKAVYIWGAGVQLGVAHTAAFFGNTDLMIKALKLSYQNTQMIDCIPDVGMYNLLLRAKGGESTQSLFLSIDTYLKTLGQVIVSNCFCESQGSSEMSGTLRGSWILGTPNEPREKHFEFYVGPSVRVIRVRINGGDDNTGDGKVEVLLYGSHVEPVLSTSTGSTDSEWAEWSVNSIGAGRYTLILRDLDTESTGRYPGNGGKYEVHFE